MSKKFRVLGGGKCRFIFYGREDFSDLGQPQGSPALARQDYLLLPGIRALSLAIGIPRLGLSLPLSIHASGGRCHIGGFLVLPPLIDKLQLRAGPCLDEALLIALQQLQRFADLH